MIGNGPRALETRLTSRVMTATEKENQGWRRLPVRVRQQDRPPSLNVLRDGWAVWDYV